MREHLKVIGMHRKSSKIIGVAEDCMYTPFSMLNIWIDTEVWAAINSYEQALAFLTGQPNTTDDFILTLLTTKASQEL